MSPKITVFNPYPHGGNSNLQRNSLAWLQFMLYRIQIV